MKFYKLSAVRKSTGEKVSYNAEADSELEAVAKFSKFLTHTKGWDQKEVENTPFKKHF